LSNAARAPGTNAPRRQILAGFHAVNARLRVAPQTIEVVYLDEQRHDARMRALAARLEQGAIRHVTAPGARLRGLAGTAPHQGVVAVCAPWAAQGSLDAFLDAAGPATLLLLLDGVTDPRNLGACLRTADAAGVGAVIVPRDRSAALTPDAARAAAGAAESVALIAVTNLARTMDELRDAGIRLAGADPADGADATAVPTLYQLDLTGPLAWVLGAEGSGLRRLTRERCDVLARIPLAGAVESLNVAVAAGICLFESVRQRAAEAARGVALAATEQSEGGLESRVITRI
jgi:23S rRNA (guanosine2251-2'-O)-methyltransferase